MKTLPKALPDLPDASLRLTINKDALVSNWRTLDRLSGDASAGAVVKADCYGLGVKQCLPALQKAGARDLFVAHMREAEEVMEHASPSDISVFHGANTSAEIAFAKAAGLRPVINSLNQAASWIAAGGGPCDLMIDTGMNRLGIAVKDVGEEIIQKLNVQTLMSHLASADEDVDQNAQQLADFKSAKAVLPHNRASLCNSAGISLGADYHFGLTRPGLSLYGGVARPEQGGLIKQVAYPEVAILQRRKLSAGDTVGYNATFTAPNVMEVATVSIGYADGFLISRGPGGALQHNNRNLPILGRVSMDLIVVDCSNAPELVEGDFLTIPFVLPQIAAASGLSQYELLTTTGNRFKMI